MLTSIDLKFLSSFACFSANSGYKGMFRLADILQTAVAIRRDVFLQFLLWFYAVFLLRIMCEIFRHFPQL